MALVALNVAAQLLENAVAEVIEHVGFAGFVVAAVDKVGAARGGECARFFVGVLGVEADLSGAAERAVAAVDEQLANEG